MRSTPIEFAKLPLGIQFVDTKGRKFEVIETFYGPLDKIKWTIETTEGHKIHAADWDDHQTAVGFLEVIAGEYTGELIIRTMEDMEIWLDNKNLEII